MTKHNKKEIKCNKTITIKNKQYILSDHGQHNKIIYFGYKYSINKTTYKYTTPPTVLPVTIQQRINNNHTQNTYTTINK